MHVEAKQPERTYGEIRRDARRGDAPSPRTSALATVASSSGLGEAEAAVHRMPLADVHFHEVGARRRHRRHRRQRGGASTYLGAEVVVSPLPMGRGFVKARHGILPLPAPAAVECLRGVPTYGVDLDVELVTPTGAAIVATVASRFERWPTFAPERIGWGAGTRELPGSTEPAPRRARRGRRVERRPTPDATT